MSEPWNFTEAQRRQFREAHAEAQRARPAATSPDPVSERELKAQREHKCPRCHLPKLNRCRAEDGTLLEHPHPERVNLVEEG